MNIFSNLTRFTSALAPNAEPYLHENFYRNIDINRKIKSGKPLCYRTSNNRKKVKHTHTEIQPVYSMYALTLTPYFPHNSQLEKQLLK